LSLVKTQRNATQRNPSQPNPTQRQTIRTMRCILLLLCAVYIPSIHSFATIPQSASVREFQIFSQSQDSSQHNTGESSEESTSTIGRRKFVTSSIGLASLGALPRLSRADDTPDGAGGVTLYKTGSGLKYIELEEGDQSGPSPRYGQLVMIEYNAYFKLPNKKDREKFDSFDGFVIKHGNGRMIPGLDEGLHTMKKGGKRQLIIPPKLGYTQFGLGPLPSNPIDTFKLNRMIDQMVTQRSGNLIFDVRLKDFFDDEADQGYYEDENPTQAEIDQIFNNLAKGKGISVTK